MTEMGKIVEAAEDLVEPVTIGPEAYVSADYARAEQDRPLAQGVAAGRASRGIPIPATTSLTTSSPTR